MEFEGAGQANGSRRPQLTIRLCHARSGEREMPVVVLAGEIDLDSAPRLNQALVDLVNAGERHIVLDMQDVTFLDSTALSVLVSALRRVRADEGSIRLSGTNAAVQKILRVTGLDKILSVHRTPTDAVAAY